MKGLREPHSTIGVCGACTVPKGQHKLHTTSQRDCKCCALEQLYDLLEALQGSAQFSREVAPKGSTCSSLDGVQVVYTASQWSCILETLCAAPQRDFTSEGLCVLP